MSSVHVLQILGWGEGDILLILNMEQRKENVSHCWSSCKMYFGCYGFTNKGWHDYFHVKIFTTLHRHWPHIKKSWYGNYQTKMGPMMLEFVINPNILKEIIDSKQKLK